MSGDKLLPGKYRILATEPLEEVFLCTKEKPFRRQMVKKRVSSLSRRLFSFYARDKRIIMEYAGRIESPCRKVSSKRRFEVEKKLINGRV